MNKVLIIFVLCIAAAVAVIAYKRPLLFTQILNPARLASTTTYKGTLPCADCPGIDVTLNIHGNGTYDQQYIYRERTGTFEENGSWSQKKGTPEDKEAFYYALVSADGKNMTYYLIAGNELQQLDTDLTLMSGPYAGSLTRQ